MKTTKEQTLLDLIDMIEDNQRDFGLYSGGWIESVRDVAQEWADEGFSAHEAREWIKARVWVPDVARRLDLRGVEPRELAGLCGTNVTGFDDPIEALCHGDLTVAGLFED